METPIKTLAEIECDYILQVLNHFEGNRLKTCSALGICIRTLRNRINEYAKAGFSIPASICDRSGNFRNRIREITVLLCDYCHVQFEREAALVRHARKNGQTQFFCCIEHFANHKYERNRSNSA